MSRVLTLLAAATAAALSALPAIAGEAYTTRIEPHGFYGATVSMEQGVRVFRPLPPVRHVVVNPGGATPLNLSFSDVRVNEQRTSHNYNYNEGGPVAYGDGRYGLGGFYGGYGGYGRHGHGSRGGRIGGDPGPSRGVHHHGGGGGGKGGHR